jgi:hypothetical protein
MLSAVVLLVGCTGSPTTEPQPPTEVDETRWTPEDEHRLGGKIGFGPDGTAWFSETHPDSTFLEPTVLRTLSTAELLESRVACSAVETIRLGEGTTTACLVGRSHRYTGVRFFDWADVGTDPLVGSEEVPLAFSDLVDCGDQDGDGFADLCTDAGVDVWPPDGLVDVSWDLPLEPRAMASADLDGDGRDEVFAVRSDGLYVLGEGLLRDASRFPRDVVRSPFANDELLYLDGDGVQRVTASGVEVWSDTSGLAIASGDFNGDGVLEVGVYRVGAFVTLDASGQRSRELTLPRHVGSGRDVLAAGDVNGDGCDDPLYSDGSSFVALLFCPFGG